MVSADYTQTQDGELRVDIGGVVADTRHDVLVVGGVATLSGTLSLEKAGGYEPAVGDRFVILTAGEVAGTFDAVDQPGGFTVAISYTGTTVEVRVASVVSIEQVEPTVVAESVVLHQNYPNPFAQTTTVSYSLAGPGYVRLTLFDLLGRQVADLDSGRRDAGRHEVVIDIGSLAQASNVGLPAGVYLYRIEVTRETQSEFAVRELVLTR
jgi:hypothetical protein